MKAAARRLKNKTLTAEVEFAGLNGGAFDQYRDEHMNVERIGVARDTLFPRNDYARQSGKLGSQMCQFLTVREIRTTRGHALDSDLEVVPKPDNFLGYILSPADTREDPTVSRPGEQTVFPQHKESGFDAEEKSYTAVMTCNPVKNDFEVRSRGVIVGHTIAKRAEQLTELRVVTSETQNHADERWDPATAAVNNVDGAALEEMLIDI